MGELLTFPAWDVETRDEGRTLGEPCSLIDPGGGRLVVEEVIRRRLIAASDPEVPVRHELLVRAAGRVFELSYTEGKPSWRVRPV